MRLQARDALLVSACVLDGPDGHAALRRLCREVDLSSDLGPGAFALLPLLHHRLQRSGLRPYGRERLAGSYRRAFYRGMLAAEAVARAVSVLRERSWEPVLCGPLSLAAGAYGSIALRPTEHVELLVHDPVGAAAALVADGFRPAGSSNGTVLAIPPAALVLTLRYDPLVEMRPQSRASSLWRPVRELDVGGVRVDAVGVSADIVAACLAPAARASAHPLQALVDVGLALSRQGTAVDWSSVAGEAAARAGRPHVRRILAAVRALGVEVPGEAFERMRRAPLAEEAASLLDRGGGGVLGGLPITFARFLRTVGDRPAAEAAGLLPLFLRETWQARSDESLPAVALRKGARFGRG